MKAEAGRDDQVEAVRRQVETMRWRRTVTIRWQAVTSGGDECRGAYDSGYGVEEFVFLLLFILIELDSRFCSISSQSGSDKWRR